MLQRFRVVLLAGLLFGVAAGNFIFRQYYLQDTFNRTRQQLILIASNAALAIDAQELLQVPLQATGDNSLAYQVIYEKLKKIKQANPILKYVYIMTTTDQPGILQYVVDADPTPAIITANCPRALPGDKYDARLLPEMLEAYHTPSADKKIYVDEWGAFISGYAPIYDGGGKPVAILGVDIDAAKIYRLQKDIRRSGLLAGVGFFVLPIALWIALISKPRE